MADLKKWAPFSRIEGDAVKGYMMGKKDGQWVFAPEAEEHIAELEAQIRDLHHELIETRNHRAELVKQLAALTWTEISESNPPKEDDEILHFDGIVRAVSERWEWEPDGGRDLEAYLHNGFMHHRPLNPPSPERGANG